MNKTMGSTRPSALVLLACIAAIGTASAADCEPSSPENVVNGVHYDPAAPISDECERPQPDPVDPGNNPQLVAFLPPGIDERTTLAITPRGNRLSSRGTAWFATAIVAEPGQPARLVSIGLRHVIGGARLVTSDRSGSHESGHAVASSTDGSLIVPVRLAQSAGSSFLEIGMGPQAINLPIAAGTSVTLVAASEPRSRLPTVMDLGRID